MDSESPKPGGYGYYLSDYDHARHCAELDAHNRKEDAHRHEYEHRLIKTARNVTVTISSARSFAARPLTMRKLKKRSELAWHPERSS